MCQPLGRHDQWAGSYPPISKVAVTRSIPLLGVRIVASRALHSVTVGDTLVR
jgi:hypothetical protein